MKIKYWFNKICLPQIGENKPQPGNSIRDLSVPDVSDLVGKVYLAQGLLAFKLFWYLFLFAIAGFIVTSILSLITASIKWIYFLIF